MTKRAVRLSLPMVRDSEGNDWKLTLVLSNSAQEPTLIFWRDPVGGAHRADYTVSAVLANACFGEPFTFGGPGCGSRLHQIDAGALRGVVVSLLDHISGRVGSFRLVWVPHDDRVPF